MQDLRSEKDYHGLAFLPLVIFLVIYLGSGILFTVLGTEQPFQQMPRTVAALAALTVAWLFFDHKSDFSVKMNVYAKSAGSPGIMMLGLVCMMAGGFQAAAAQMGGKDAIVNMGLSFIPPSLLIPGIFLITCFISTCIGTSTGTQVAMIPVGVAVASGAGLNPAMAGAAVIAGAYFGDNLSMISDTTICAAEGCGSDMKDKFRVNFLIALPAAIITCILYYLAGSGSYGEVPAAAELSYSIWNILPYITVLATAIAGLNVVLVLIIGIVMTGVIGIFQGSITFFGWIQAIGSGMEDLFFLFVFASMISGLIGLVRYYGGIDWLVRVMKAGIKDRKSCEYLISFMALAICGATVNNTVAIVITAPIAKELGSRYGILPKRLASLIDIFSCAMLCFLPHDSGMLLVQQYANVSYLEILKYSFYPALLLLVTCLTIQFRKVPE